MVVERWATNYGGIAVTNDGPIHLKMANEVLRIEQFRLAGEQGTRFLQVHGEVQLGGKREIDLRADGSLNLKLLETADPNLMAGGVANLNLQVNGTLARPSMRGRLNLQNGAINYIDFPNGLSDSPARWSSTKTACRCRRLTARTGGGLLHCARLHHVLSVAGAGLQSVGQRARDSIALSGGIEFDRRCFDHADRFAEKCGALRRCDGDAAGSESAI